MKGSCCGGVLCGRGATAGRDREVGERQREEDGKWSRDAAMGETRSERGIKSMWSLGPGLPKLYNQTKYDL